MAKSKGKNAKKKKRKGRIGSLIIIIVALVVMLFALMKLIPILSDYHQSNTAYRELAGEVVSIGEDMGPELEDWQKVRIDFDSLWEINTDIIGWIRFDDTDAVKVDYPILHAADDATYLRTDMYMDHVTAGSIFLEAQNSGDFSDPYNIIYGHNMRNLSMFGTLKQYRLDDTFYEDNQYFTIYTPREAYRYHIFAYFVAEDGTQAYTVGFTHDEAYQEQIDYIMSKSMIDTGITPNVQDDIVALSTCTSRTDTERFIVCGLKVDTYVYDD